MQWTVLCEFGRLLTNGVVYGVNSMGLMFGAAVCWPLQLVRGSDVVVSGRRACVLALVDGKLHELGVWPTGD